MTERTQEALRQEVLGVIDQQARAFNTGDINAYLAILTEDAVFLPPNEPAKTGEELRTWLSTFLEEFTVEGLRYDTQEAVVTGNLAYHRHEFRWTVIPKAGGKPMLAQGKGIDILRRGPDCCWKLARIIWNATP